LCYKSDGTRDWEATISKNQTFKSTVRDPALRWDSYTCGLVGDKLYFLYNNLNLGGTWKEVNGALNSRSSFIKAGNPPFMYEVEANGNVKFGDKMYGLPLFKMYSDIYFSGVSICPGFSVPTPNGLIIMCGAPDGKQLQLGMIK
jgi:hypothetical protein